MRIIHGMVVIAILLLSQATFAQSTELTESPAVDRWMNVGDARFSAGAVSQTRLAFSPSGDPWVAYINLNDSGRVTVMRFDGQHWTTIGTSPWRALDLSLAFSPSGQPYVAFQDIAEGSRVTVIKFDGINWAIVGNKGFSEGLSWFINVAFNSTGDPFVAYANVNSGPGFDKPTVMKFDGTAWVYVGDPLSITGTVLDMMNLVISPSDEPLIAFPDAQNFARVTVMRYDGTAWQNVGNPGFSSIYASRTSLALGPSGEPYVAFCDQSMSKKVTVMKYDGATWQYVGIPGFSEDTTWYISLKFSPGGEPVLAYNDFHYHHKATVMKFDGSSWQTVGNAGFTPAQAKHISLAFNPKGQPTLAFADGYQYSDKASVMYFGTPLGIDEIAQSPLHLFPNPAGNHITLETTLKGRLSILNTFGMELLSQTVSNPSTGVDLSSLPSGVFFVTLTTPSAVHVSKIVKQ